MLGFNHPPIHPSICMTHVVVALPNQPNRHIICPRNAINVEGKLLSVYRWQGRSKRTSSRSKRGEDVRRSDEPSEPANMQVQQNREDCQPRFLSQRVVCQHSRRKSNRLPPLTPYFSGANLYLSFISASESWGGSSKSPSSSESSSISPAAFISSAALA